MARSSSESLSSNNSELTGTAALIDLNLDDSRG